MKALSRILNRTWNLGHNNDDADFDWWEWYGLHPVKRYWKRKTGNYVKELAGGPNSIVNLGCGSSPITNLFSSRVVGVDINGSKIDFMREHSKAEFVVGDITRMEPVGKFEAVLCNEVLEHLGEGEGELGKAVEVLADHLEENGIIVITFPDYGSWYGRLLERLVHGALHDREFTKKELLKACKSCNLEPVAERRFLWDTVIAFRREEL